MTHQESGDRRVGVVVLVAIALAAFFFATQFATPRIIENDGHFHIRYSRLLLERGIPERLPELRYTIWNDAYRDHHFLFHVLLIPFSLFPDIAVGAKAAAATFATIAGLAFFWALSQFCARGRWLWMLLFAAGSAGFLFRMQLPRVQSLALALLIVVTVALLKRRTRLLFAAAFINVWLYDSFLLLVIVGAAWLACSWIFAGRWEMKSLAALGAGLAAGMAINPFFPENFASYWFHIQRSVGLLGEIPLPAEWLPSSRLDLALTNAPILIVGFGLIALAVVARRRLPRPGGEARAELVFLLILAHLFMVLTFRSRRFIEYAPPMFLLFFAVAHRDLWPAIASASRPWLGAAAAAVALVGGGINTVAFVRENQPDATYRCYLDAGKWIDEHVPAGELIFPTDWDDFPILYLNAPSVRYVVGLDPLFMLRYDPELWRLYADVTLGERPGPYAPIVADRFGARYVFTDTQHGAFLEKFDREPGVYRVFSEPECRVYQIGHPPHPDPLPL